MPVLSVVRALAALIRGHRISLTHSLFVLIHTPLGPHAPHARRLTVNTPHFPHMTDGDNATSGQRSTSSQQPRSVRTLETALLPNCHDCPIFRTQSTPVVKYSHPLLSAPSFCALKIRRTKVTEYICSNTSFAGDFKH